MWYSESEDKFVSQVVEELTEREFQTKFVVRFFSCNTGLTMKCALVGVTCQVLVLEFLNKASLKCETL